MTIRYIEIKPIPQTLEFENREKWNEFFGKRIKEIIDYTYSNNVNYEEYYVYKRIILNKDGTPRKTISPDWLNTKKSRKKQRKNWLAYVEKRKNQTLKKNYLKQLSELDAKINDLQEQKIELEKTFKSEYKNENKN